MGCGNNRSGETRLAVPQAPDFALRAAPWQAQALGDAAFPARRSRLAARGGRLFPFPVPSRTVTMVAWEGPGRPQRLARGERAIE